MERMRLELYSLQLGMRLVVLADRSMLILHVFGLMTDDDDDLAVDAVLLDLFGAVVVAMEPPVPVPVPVPVPALLWLDVIESDAKSGGMVVVLRLRCRCSAMAAAE